MYKYAVSELPPPLCYPLKLAKLDSRVSSNRTWNCRVDKISIFFIMASNWPVDFHISLYGVLGKDMVGMSAYSMVLVSHILSSELKRYQGYRLIHLNTLADLDIWEKTPLL